MPGKLFGKKSTNKPSSSVGDSQDAALQQVIAEKRNEDPLIGAKIGGKDITQRLLGVMKTDRGVHMETLLAVIGSLGGFACHMAVRDAIVETGKASESDVFTLVEGADGKKYYFSDVVNQPLVEDKISLWSLVGGAAQHLDKDGLPDIRAIFAHVSSTVGGDDFGVPQMPEGHQPAERPLKLLRSLWPALLPIIDRYCESPVERPYLFGFCAQEAIAMGKDVIAPGLAAQLIMECAVPMSKAGPEWLTS